jgi:hypothetical protein
MERKPLAFRWSTLRTVPAVQASSRGASIYPGFMLGRQGRSGTVFFRRYPVEKSWNGIRIRPGIHFPHGIGGRAAEGPYLGILGGLAFAPARDRERRPFGGRRTTGRSESRRYPHCDLLDRKAQFPSTRFTPAPHPPQGVTFFRIRHDCCRHPTTQSNSCRPIR